MLIRTTFVAAAAALALPLLGGSAHASCLDDANAGTYEGYSQSPKSQYWNGFNYVQYSGSATVTVQGDALVSDYASYLTKDWPLYLTLVATNTPGVTTEFVDCVAG